METFLILFAFLLTLMCLCLLASAILINRHQANDSQGGQAF